MQYLIKYIPRRNIFLRALFVLGGADDKKEFAFEAKQGLDSDLRRTDDDAWKIFEERSKVSKKATLYKKIS